MRVRVEFTLSARGTIAVEELPLDFELNGSRVVVSARGDGPDLDLVVDVPVDPSTVRIVTDVCEAATGSPVEMLEIGEDATATVIANRVADGVSFISRAPIFVSRKELYSELIPEDDQDAAHLDALGMSVVRGKLSAGSPGIWMPWPLEPANIAFLNERPAATRLYADALKMGTSAGRLREFWRVLESAFGEDGGTLVGLVSSCEAARDMEFTESEFRDLYKLRGRASHAQSKSGVDEASAVEREAARVVNRLQGLAEALVVRKVHWGNRTLEMHPLSRPLPFIRSDGARVLFTTPEQDCR